MSTIDLTKVNSRSIASILQNNYKQIMDTLTSGSVNKAYNLVAKLFNEANLDTKATTRLLANINKSKSTNEAMFIISNSLLAGSGNAVI